MAKSYFFKICLYLFQFPEQLITPCEHDVDDQDDFDETIDEDQIHIIEAFLEEALTSGTSRMSSVAPSAR